MKKSILILTLTLFAVVSFGTKSYAQDITIQNDLASSVTVTICSSPYNLVTGEIYYNAISPCSGGGAPCSFDVQTPCMSTAANFGVPCAGVAPYLSTQTFPGTTTVPACPGFTVSYTYDISGNINIHIY